MTDLMQHLSCAQCDCNSARCCLTVKGIYTHGQLHTQTVAHTDSCTHRQLHTQIFAHTTLRHLHSQAVPECSDFLLV